MGACAIYINIICTLVCVIFVKRDYDTVFCIL